ncbi:hypothetical protein Syun_030190 [Stephania yunnanensis]|uniref:non-specific serine/threonine protein kinase n=1 Tax=Stephania yunnanensis TaxID=152371 RepID=A0AAP0HKK4_9MAGN
MSSPIREPFSLHQQCYILLLILCLFLVPLKTSPTPTTEAQALIRWKTSLVFQSSLLNSWALTKTSSLCEWNGITCHNGGSVTEITLTDMNLSGTLHQFDFTAFPNLTRFVLDHNNLNGKIPSAIATLSKLIFLDLSGNNFYDGIPPEIGKLSELGFLNLYANSLEGPVPYQIGSLQKVWFMDLGSNLLTSFDSSRFSSMPHLTHLSLSYNNFSGKFPPFIFKCKNLTYLDMSSNGFNDLFPDVMINLVRLEYLNLTSNEFRGPLPANLSKLASSKHLRIGANEFTGKIPDDIGLLSNLQILELHNNSLTGRIPASVGQLVMLERLDLHAAGLTSIIPSELGSCTNLTFMDLSLNSLAGIGNLKNLKLLDLSRERALGQIPHTIWNLTQLTMLNLFDNILGSIPREIGNLTALQTLDIGINELSGELPHTLSQLESLQDIHLVHQPFFQRVATGLCNDFFLEYFTTDGNNFFGSLRECLKNCSRLTTVGVQGNKLSGDISSALGVHPNLDYINLGRNQFSGELSQNWWDYKELTNFHMDGNENLRWLWLRLEVKNLKFLTLSSNKLTGSIPAELGYLTSMSRLNLSGNRLDGDIPSGLGKLTDLEVLDLSNNLLTGNIPTEVGDSARLAVLNLSNNILSGEIPSELGNLTSLQIYLDISHNALSGTIPRDLGNLILLEALDLSHNALSGQIPPTLSQMLSNPGLCGDAEGLPSCNPINPGERSTEHPKNTKRRKNLVIPIVVPIAGLLVIIIFVVGTMIFLRTTKGSREEFVSTKRSKSFESLAWEREGKFTFNDIVKGTDNFNDMYCIGKGEFGIIYKAMLQTGQVVAVKQLNVSNLSDILEISHRSFLNEIQILTDVRHKNIVKLYGFYSKKGCIYLVYDFVERGSLGKLLRKDAEGRQANLGHSD